MSATIIPWPAPARRLAAAPAEAGDYGQLAAWARVRALMAEARPTEPNATDEILACLRRIERAISCAGGNASTLVLSPDQRVTRRVMPSSSDRRTS